MTIPKDILRVLDLLDWSMVYVDHWRDGRLYIATDEDQGGAPAKARSAYDALPLTQARIINRASEDRCRTPLDRLVREYMLWRVYTTPAKARPVA